MLHAHSYRGFTSQRFNPAFQTQPQLVVETSSSGGSIAEIAFVIECSSGPRSATVFTSNVPIERRSGSFAGLAAVTATFTGGAAEPGVLNFQGAFVGKKKIRGNLAFDSPSCHVPHAAWVAFR